jgi:hypothetical protein
VCFGLSGGYLIAVIRLFAGAEKLSRPCLNSVAIMLACQNSLGSNPVESI